MQVATLPQLVLSPLPQLLALEPQVLLDEQLVYKSVKDSAKPVCLDLLPHRFDFGSRHLVQSQGLHCSEQQGVAEEAGSVTTHCRDSLHGAEDGLEVNFAIVRNCNLVEREGHVERVAPVAHSSVLKQLRMNKAHLLLLLGQGEPPSRVETPRSQQATQIIVFAIDLS